MGTALASMHCRPLTGVTPMDDAAITRHLAQVPGWALVDGAIEKRFEFADFHHTMAFVNALAWIAHVEDHHPDVSFGYKQCTVRYHTHSVGGLSVNDFICAAKIDALRPA